MREQAGELVRVDEVRAEASRLALLVRDSLLNLPDRLAPVVAAESDPAAVHRLLDSELRRVLTSLAVNA
jgi:hypothetical protein